MSEAFDLVESVEHPSHADGGPCDGCAFRRGTEANLTPHTVMLAAACVEGLRPFYCHEHPGLCRGFVAASNVRGPVRTKAERRHLEASRFVADCIADAIAVAKKADEQR